MIIAGLTGSIAMGKTTVANYMRSRGIPVFDSDAAVHALYEGEAAPLIEAAFPGTTKDGKVDREALWRAVVNRPERMRQLEAIVHPLVRRMQWAFLKREKEMGADLAVLEIPLLFETAKRELFDAVIVVSAPPDQQRARLMERPGMTQEKAEALIARQIPDAEKRALADYIVDTGVPLPDTFTQIDAVLADIRSRPATAIEHWQREAQSF